MNTEEAIAYLKSTRMEDYGYRNEYDEIIELLKRGEKYEQMWEELYKNPEYLTTKAEMYNIKQKYFPKPKSKVLKLLKELDKEVNQLLGELGV